MVSESVNVKDTLLSFLTAIIYMYLLLIEYYNEILINMKIILSLL